MKKQKTPVVCVFYKPEEVAAIAGVDRPQVMKWIKSGELNALKLSYRTYRVWIPEAHRFVEERKKVLIEDPNFLENTAELGRALGLPALTEAAERVIRQDIAAQRQHYVKTGVPEKRSGAKEIALLSKEMGLYDEEKKGDNYVGK